MKTKIFTLIVAALWVQGLAQIASATPPLVEIGVATDKSTYQLGETVQVLVSAYNPNPQEVTLVFPNTLQASYIMDGVFDWAWGKFFFTIVTEVTIAPGGTYTWIRWHNPAEMQHYPLNVGTHSVVGEIGAPPIGPVLSSDPAQFEVIPEPTVLLLLSFGIIHLRVSKHRALRKV